MVWVSTTGKALKVCMGRGGAGPFMGTAAVIQLVPHKVARSRHNSVSVRPQCSNSDIVQNFKK